MGSEPPALGHAPALGHVKTKWLPSPRYSGELVSRRGEVNFANKLDIVRSDWTTNVGRQVFSGITGQKERLSGTFDLTSQKKKPRQELNLAEE
jgi:hypothetical protein